MDGDTVFKPLFINYKVDFSYDHLRQDYYITPHSNYSSLWGISPTHYTGGYSYSISGANFSNQERAISRQKLNFDLNRMKSLGFNVVRIAPIISWDRYNCLSPDTIHIVVDDNVDNPDSTILYCDFSTYFTLMDSLLYTVASHDLHAVLVLGADSSCWKYYNSYCTFLDSVSSHYKNNTTIMAYIVLAEPFYIWKMQSENDKLRIANYSKGWYYLMKKNDPNHLISYGIQHPMTVINWDPEYLTCDFISFHLYHWSKNLSQSKIAMATYYKWINDNFNGIWALGETGYSGTDIAAEQDEQTGTEAMQEEFATFTMQRSLDCGCLGYSWWQFQDVKWGDHFQDNLGIYTVYPQEIAKKISLAFPKYDSIITNRTNCKYPASYKNFYGYTYLIKSGRIVDSNYHPISGAVICSNFWKSDNDTLNNIFTTITNSNGYYNLYVPYATYDSLREYFHTAVSYPGYNTKIINVTNSDFSIDIINPIHYNNWKKMWCDTTMLNRLSFVIKGKFISSEQENLLRITPIRQTATLYTYENGIFKTKHMGHIGGWQIRNIDKFYAMDYDGDGIDELLCIQNIDDGYADIYKFDSNSRTWVYKFTNSGSGRIGNWRIKKDDVFCIGKFEGNSKDNLLCIDQDTRKCAKLLYFNNSSVFVSWSDTLWIGEWYIRSSDTFQVGDFDGDSQDELLCCSNYSDNSDYITAQKLILTNSPQRGSSHTWSTFWSNYGNPDHALYPYRKKIIIGNFDQDSADEILGISTWATKFDFSVNNFHWTWSTYNDCYISDWNINANDKLFFFKALKHVPEMLFIISNSNHRNCALFSMDNYIQ